MSFDTNEYLEKQYLPEHNRRFARAAAKPEDYHGRKPTARELREVFRLEVERTISKDWVLRHEGRYLQLKPAGQPARHGGQKGYEAAFAYARQIGEVGNFSFICTTVVLNPQQERTHYHLIYATRHHKGVQVFKDAERHASGLMAYVRADAQQRRRINSTGQDELFLVQEHGAGDDEYIAALRNRYSTRAREFVMQALSERRLQPLPYEQVWGAACLFPLVWERDLHHWIQEWKKQGKLENARNETEPEGT